MNQIKIQNSITVRSDTINAYLADISRIPMVTPEEEVELARRIHDGDEKALHTLVNANLRFAFSVAKQYQGQGMELSDVVSYANAGLIKAAEKFDDTLGFKFISYAVWWIRQSILQGLSEQGRMVRLPLNQIGVINKARKEIAKFQQSEMREPTTEELAGLVGLPESKLQEAGRVAQTHMSFDAPLGEEDGDGALIDIYKDTNVPATDSKVMSESLETDIDRVFTILPEREAEILRMCFGIGCAEMSLEEIGEKFDLTRERVRQIKEKAIRRLRTPAAANILRSHL